MILFVLSSSNALKIYYNLAYTNVCKICMILYVDLKKIKMVEMNCQMIRNVITQVLFGAIKNTGGDE